MLIILHNTLNELILGLETTVGEQYYESWFIPKKAVKHKPKRLNQ